MKFEIFQKDLFFPKNCISKFHLFRISTGLEESYKGENAEFDNKRPAPNKRRNQHLNRQITVNGENFEFERDIIEKKTPSDGPEFGLEPDYGPDGKIIRDRKTGKPRAKQNKANYRKFTDNLEEFVKEPKSERIEPQYRKGRENEQDAVGFLNQSNKEDLKRQK